MYATVVVALDGSPLAEAALGPARHLAEAFGAGIVLLSAVQRDEDLTSRQDYLSATRERVPGATTALRVGDPAARIARAVDRPHTVVCMSTHGRGGLGRAVLGSVAEQVLREVAAPLLLVGPGYRPAHPLALSEVVVALDGSRAAEGILPTAADWARALGLPIRLLATARPRAVNEAGSASFANGASDLSEGGHLANLVARLRAQDLDAQWDVLYGDQPAGAIASHLQHRPGCLVAVAAGSGEGSLALRLAHEVDGPILVQRTPARPAGSTPRPGAVRPPTASAARPPREDLEQLIRVLQAHAAAELDSLDAYRRLSGESTDPVVASLMAMVIADEERHHGLLEDMQALLDADDSPSSPEPGSRDTTGHALAVTRAYIRDEREGIRHLRTLARQHARQGHDLVALLLSTMAVDSQKHELILRYILQRLEKHQ